MTKTKLQDDCFPIGSVERDTGISRDTLRVWERRYGFPTPVRNKKGERLYPADQIRRLQLIRRLLDQGLRPGRIVSLDDADLSELADSLPGATPRPGDINHERARLFSLAASGDMAGLSAALEHTFARTGLRGFVLDTFAPLTGAIGELWAGGQLAIFEEHLLTQELIQFPGQAMSRCGRPAGKPQVLLATLPGEQPTPVVRSSAI